jgi:predicted RNA-binding Zn-ribbon protein involved in translation (DUF1610 family)
MQACPGCGNAVSWNATNCPKCGRTFVARAIAVVLVPALIILIVIVLVARAVSPG